VGQAIFPVPWHVGHSVSASAKFKVEKSRIAINEAIKNLLFKNSLLPKVSLCRFHSYKHLECINFLSFAFIGIMLN
jgi:hypothetical protein